MTNRPNWQELQLLSIDGKYPSLCLQLFLINSIQWKMTTLAQMEVPEHGTIPKDNPMCDGTPRSLGSPFLDLRLPRFGLGDDNCWPVCPRIAGIIPESHPPLNDSTMVIILS
jgi:hypothetical protein